ncbi:aldo/keto reductase [Streptomyces sp. NPDC001982]|uniref:aldo/keto reductase n=1 Tax=Streptomyces sp. NPDC001982 TaxID=3154405 RepID=UPI00331CA805
METASEWWMRPGPNGKGLSHKAVMTEIDHSLRRLGTDYVDVYMIHRLDNETSLEETLEALHDVVKSDKARYLGASSMRGQHHRVLTGAVTAAHHSVAVVCSPDALPASHWSHPRLKAA